MTAPKSGNSRVPDACRGRRPKFEWTPRRFGRSRVLFATAFARALCHSPEKSRTKMKPPRARTSPRNRKECFCRPQTILPRQRESGQPDPTSDTTAAFPRDPKGKDFARHTTPHLSPGPSLRTPRPSPLLHRCNTIAPPCTTRVAVTHLPLDRRKTSRLKSD